jgi:hypothetical protein
MVIIETDGLTDRDGLPACLLAEKSLYFSKILFLLIGQKIPHQMVVQFHDHFKKNQKIYERHKVPDPV